MLDISYYRKRLREELEDPEFQTEYHAARAEIAQVDAVMRKLDQLRENAGLTKAELARRIGKNPAAIRRLFSSKVNPELQTVAALAAALGAEIQIALPKQSAA